MTDTEADILKALRELDALAAQRGNVLPILHSLDSLTRALPKDADPDLLHYLHKRSYEKARIHLEGAQPDPGTCAR